MAAPFSHWPVFIFTFLLVISLLTSAQEISLVKEPEDNYYIVKKLPVVIVCQARNAAEITFTCLGTQIPSTSVEVKDVSEIDPELIEAEIEVTRADVTNSEKLGQFWCQCSAVDLAGNVVVTSRKGNVSIASLKNKFLAEPKSTAATVGDDVEFACVAPEGDPKPEIMWRKDKKRLEVENNPRIYVSGKNSLIIQSVTLADKGQYQCIARNLVGRRESQEAQLTVTALAESAEPDLEVLEKDIASKKAAGSAGKLRATRQSIKTYFTTEPQEKYYITRDKDLIIDCGVVAADILTFRCNGKRMGRDQQTMTQGLDQSGNRAIQAHLNITYYEGEQFLKETQQDKGFQCVCVAWYQDSSDPHGWGKLDSNPSNGFVYLAYLDTDFQVEPTDVTAGLNSDAVLICEPPKGQPSPWVYWYKDRTRLDPRTTEKYSMNAKGHLTIHNVQYEDAGTYNCLAENSVSSAQSRPGRLIVTETVTTTTAASADGFPTFPAVIPSSPVFIRDFESEYTFGPDGTKTMVCAVVSAEQMTIDCGGQRLKPGEFELKSEVHRETGKRLLYLTADISADKLQSDPEDFFCQCTAWFLNEDNSWGRIASAQGYIREGAQQAFIEDKFELPPEDTDASYESGAELFCQPPAGFPLPKVYWLKDGVRIDTEEDPNFVVVESGSLFIELVRVTDEGEYVCVAENEAGSRQSQPIQFTVLDKPVTEDQSTTAEPESEQEVTTAGSDTATYDLDEPAFVHEPESEYYVDDDAPVTLTCVVVAAKTLVFVCNGEILKETATTGYHYAHPETQQIMRENSLIITRDRVEEYTGSEPYSCVCRAYYQKGKGPTAETLTVESFPTSILVPYLEENFLEEPSDTEVSYLDRAVLSCRPPNGGPRPKVHWLKDSTLLHENDRIRVEESGRLIIDRFTVNDEGAYTCVANNTFDSLFSKPAQVTLIVSAEPYPEPDKETSVPEPETTPSDTEKLFSGSPYISKDLHSVYYVIKNKPVTITCEAYSVEYITFTCGMKTMTLLEKREMVEELSLPNGQSSLVNVVEATIEVPKSDVEDYEPGKEFWCQCYAYYRTAGTDVTSKLESGKGVVEIAYLKKNFQKEPENQTVDEGDSLTVVCQPPIGNPPPKVTWTKDGNHIEAFSGPEGVLIIPETSLSDAGEYICVAKNEAAERLSRPSIVTVKGLDDISPMPNKPETEENVDGETEEGSQANVDESEVDSDANREAEEVTESSLNRETDQSTENGKPEENVDRDDRDNINKELTEWQVSEGGQELPVHNKLIEDNVEENIQGNTKENKTETLEGGGNVETQNKKEEYEERDKSSYEDHDEIHEGIFDNKRYEEIEKHSETKPNKEDKDNSYEEEDETIETEEDGNINGIGSRKSFEGNECAQMLSSCSNILPRNVDHIVFCAAVPDYTACVDNYFIKCNGIINEISMNAVRMAYKDTQQKCTLQRRCPKLRECKVISSNALENSMDKSEITVQELCVDTNSFLQCVDNNLEDCDVTLSPHEDEDRPSYDDIVDWFAQFCGRFINRNDELTLCEDFKTCTVDVEKLAADNTTYWCNLVKSISGCTDHAVQQCELDSLLFPLNDFHSKNTDRYCTGLPEVTSEPEGEIDPTDEGGSYTTDSTDEGSQEKGEDGTEGMPNVTSEPDGEPGGEAGSTEVVEVKPADGDSGEANKNSEADAEGKHKVGNFDSEDDFEYNHGNKDTEDADKEDADVVVSSKAQETFSSNSDNSEEKYGSSEDYDNERDEKTTARKNNNDYSAGRQKSEEEDGFVSVDDISKSPAEGDGSTSKVEEEDQDEAESSMVGASKEDSNNRSSVTGTPILLATILQLLTAVCLSWR